MSSSKEPILHQDIIIHPLNVAIKNDPFEALNKHNNYLVEIVQTIIGQRQAPANLGKTKTKYFPQNTGH